MAVCGRFNWTGQLGALLLSGYPPRPLSQPEAPPEQGGGKSTSIRTPSWEVPSLAALVISSPPAGPAACPIHWRWTGVLTYNTPNTCREADL